VKVSGLLSDVPGVTNAALLLSVRVVGEVGGGAVADRIEVGQVDMSALGAKVYDE
jgi:hypothetical protein